MIAWFARNTVAANLLMVAIIFAGAYTLLSNKIPLEVFPEWESNVVNVTVPYRGGTPEEVEELLREERWQAVELSLCRDELVLRERLRKGETTTTTTGRFLVFSPICGGGCGSSGYLVYWFFSVVVT